MVTVFLFFDPLVSFYFWDAMFAHVAVILHHNTHVQVNPKPILFSKVGGGDHFRVILTPRTVFLIPRMMFVSMATILLFFLNPPDFFHFWDPCLHMML